MIPLSRLLQGCTDHTISARIPPNPALLNGSVVAVRRGKAGTLLNTEGALEKVFFAIKTPLRPQSCGECASRNSAEGQQQPRAGEHFFCTAGGLRWAACPHVPVTPARGGERALSEFSSPGQPGHRVLPQRGMLWAREGEPECLLGSWHSLPSCCCSRWEDGGGFVHPCCPTAGSWYTGVWARGRQSASVRPPKHHGDNNAGQIPRSVSNKCCYSFVI